MGPKWPLTRPISSSNTVWKNLASNLPILVEVVVTSIASWPPPNTTYITQRSKVFAFKLLQASGSQSGLHAKAMSFLIIKQLLTSPLSPDGMLQKNYSHPIPLHLPPPLQTSHCHQLKVNWKWMPEGNLWWINNRKPSSDFILRYLSHYDKPGFNPKMETKILWSYLILQTYLALHVVLWIWCNVNWNNISGVKCVHRSSCIHVEELTCSLIGESDAEFTGLSVLYVFMCLRESVSKSCGQRVGYASTSHRQTDRRKQTDRHTNRQTGTDTDTHKHRQSSKAISKLPFVSVSKRVCAKPFIWKCVSSTGLFSGKSKLFSYQRFCAKWPVYLIQMLTIWNGHKIHKVIFAHSYFEIAMKGTRSLQPQVILTTDL